MSYKIFGQHELNTLDQFEKVAKRAVKSALMADGHAGYVMPVGGVAAYDNEVSVMGVGFDIACGNCAIKTNLKLEEITRHKINIRDANSNPHYVSSDKYLNKFADEIESTISFGLRRGAKNQADDAPIDHKLFLDPAWYIIPNAGAQISFRNELLDKARNQLGTVGSGNHYVDVFADEEGVVWVGVHFGSRGLGHTIASQYLARGQGGNWGDKGKEIETMLNLDSQLGQEYWQLMELAGEYAYVGREWVARKVVSILGGEVVDMVHNHHNFAWKETHAIYTSNGMGGSDVEHKEVVVVRKGATPAFPGQRGFVGGSMGDNAVILEGTINETDSPLVIASQQEALFSTVHGAGRVMSRRAAAGKWRKGRQVEHGKVTPTMMQDWLTKKGVVLRGGGLDESPHAYRRLDKVLEAQGPTVTVLHTLRPLVVVMASPTEVDPYKD